MPATLAAAGAPRQQRGSSKAAAAASRQQGGSSNSKAAARQQGSKAARQQGSKAAKQQGSKAARQQGSKAPTAVAATSRVILGLLRNLDWTPSLVLSLLATNSAMPLGFLQVLLELGEWYDSSDRDAPWDFISPASPASSKHKLVCEDADKGNDRQRPSATIGNGHRQRSARAIGKSHRQRSATAIGNDRPRRSTATVS